MKKFKEQIITVMQSPEKLFQQTMPINTLKQQ
jgi:hypothetical protein